MTRDDFWSRRRAAVAAEAQASERALIEAETAERDAELAARPEADVLQDLGLPDPDTLGAGDDFKVFLTDKVPGYLRKRALRRLWMTNPVLANVDGLVDYGEDFTDAAMVPEIIQTAYQVGKGMKAHVDELVRQAQEEAAEAAHDQPAQDTDSDEEIQEDIGDENQEEIQSDLASVAGPATLPLDQTQDRDAPEIDPHAALVVPVMASPPAVATAVDTEAAPMLPRRMRFSFKDDGQDI
ncbi:DUF3306 domain-containing protein [Rhodobacteraceae bacterium M382]|nr:DUF3306 domain-containing protein [Rhodobacteraceae bacterium M382]